MIIAIIITSLIWLLVGLGGLYYLCIEKERMLDDLYDGISHSSLTPENKKRVYELLKYYFGG